MTKVGQSDPNRNYKKSAIGSTLFAIGQKYVDQQVSPHKPLDRRCILEHIRGSNCYIRLERVFQFRHC